MSALFGMSSRCTYIKLERSRHSIYSLSCLLSVQTADSEPPPRPCSNLTRTPLTLLAAFLFKLSNSNEETAFTHIPLSRRVSAILGRVNVRKHFQRADEAEHI